MATPIVWDRKESEVAIVDLADHKYERLLHAGQDAAVALETSYDKHCDLLLTSPYRGRQLESRPDLRSLKIEVSTHLYIVYKAIPERRQIVPAAGIVVPSYGNVFPGQGLIVILRVLWSNGQPTTCIV